MKRELGIARCGLACCLCSENASCTGCAQCVEKNDCENRECSMKKGLAGCYECTENCRKGLLAKGKPYGFIQFIRQYGQERLLDCLEANEKRGVVYHRQGITGDYDECGSIEELFRLIETGKKE